MSGENTATCRGYAPDDLVKGLRELAQIGIVNHKHDTVLLTAAAEYIEILTRSVDRFLAEQLRKGKITPNEARAAIGLPSIPEDEHTFSGLLEE